MMAHRRLSLEVLFRLAVALAMLFNALIPSVTAAAISSGKSSSANQPNQSKPSVVQPSLSNAKYQPPKKITRPTRFNPSPDQSASPIPPKSQIEFSLSSDTSILDSNNQITIKALIRNNSSQELDNLTFTDPLEPGIIYVPGPNPSLPFDATKKQISLPIAKILPGQ
ncbi:MAG TPA: hypothetical protein VLZ89_02930 [Anaerolineales bacterium]|nr:hypothetical protein [Anaerolineales bacterium]